MNKNKQTVNKKCVILAKQINLLRDQALQNIWSILKLDYLRLLKNKTNLKAITKEIKKKSVVLAKKHGINEKMVVEYINNKVNAK